MTSFGGVVSLYGWYANNNLGDDLLLESSLSILARTNCRVVLYGDKDKVEAVLAQFPDNIRGIVIDIRRRTATSVIRDALVHDAFMVGGGGIFPTKNYPKGLFYLLTTILYRLRGKRVIFAGVSIEEFNFNNPIMSRVVRGLIRFSSYFSMRDSFYTQSALPESVKHKVKTIPDLVFSLPVESGMRNTRNEAVICCANIFTKSPQDVLNTFVQDLSSVINWLLAQGYSVSLAAFSSSDEALNRSVAGCVCSSETVRLKTYSYDETRRRCFDLFKNASISICMRFHSLVLSQLSQCPYISISYSNKNIALLDDLGLSHWQVPFGTGENEYLSKTIDLDAEKIIDLLEQLIGILPVYFKQLSNKNIEIERSKELATTEILDLLYKEAK